MSELIWIAVPNGRSSGRPNLRVMISPRLSVSPLSEAGLAHWPPAELLTSPLVVEFAADGGTVVHSRAEVTPPHIQVEAGAWESLFKPDLEVRPVARRGDAFPDTVENRRRSRLIQTDGVAAQAVTVDGTFRAAATVGFAAEARRHPALESEVRLQLDRHWRSLAQSAETELPPVPQDDLPAPPPPDFHRMIAMLREHPTVLRSLGLVFDIELGETDLPQGMADPRLRVRPSNPPAGMLPVASPWTRYGSDFLPAGSDTIQGGMVVLSAPGNPAAGDWDVVSVDVENAAERLRQLAMKTAQAAPEAESQVQMPAMRSAGLMLVKHNRAGDLDQRRKLAAANAGLASSAEVVLASDDLLIGYRLDIREQASKEWRSLHQRDASYYLGEARTRVRNAAVSEEGHVKPYAVVDDGTDVLKASDVVARWDGWSLSVPRPAFDAPERAQKRRKALDNSSHKIAWDFAVTPGTLPQLRFGRSYRVRARAAYFADAGLPPGVLDETYFKEKIYLRYEPILSPEVSMPGAAAGNWLGPSETATEVVLRGDRNTTPAAFAAANPRYGERLERRIAPPRASLALAEQHGALDAAGTDDAWDRIEAAIAGEPMQAETAPALADFAAAGIRVVIRGDNGESVGTSDRPWSGTWPNFAARSIELKPRLAGEGGQSVAWEQHAGGLQGLVVRLAPAEQVVLDLSSFPLAGLRDHFAAAPFLAAGMADAFAAGRHPLITPATSITLTHAVRRPLADPAGGFGVRREVNRTFADLIPEPAMLGLDAKSTGQVDVRASWTEFLDDRREPQTDIPVQSLLIGRSDAALSTLRHEFADTKRRIVSYAATAISRYRSYFDADEDPAAFRTDGLLSQVDIPSSARPAPPVVMSIGPAFRWERSDEGASGIVHRRHGGRLRVELARPWFTTGEGEMLAVVVWPDGPPLTSAMPYVTRLALDPIWETDAPVQWPDAGGFAGMAGETRQVTLSETGASVTALPFAPFFDDGRWFADIEMPIAAASSYAPFVRLAVARYQPHSVVEPEGDLCLSPTVVTDMVQLLPDRDLRIERLEDNSVAVMLSGLGPRGPRQNRVDVLVEQSDAPGEMIVLGQPDPRIPGWRPISGFGAQLELNTRSNPLALPTGPSLTRIRVREVETVGMEASDGTPRTGTPDELAERVVFTDTIILA